MVRLLFQLGVLYLLKNKKQLRIKTCPSTFFPTLLQVYIEWSIKHSVISTAFIRSPSQLEKNAWCHDDIRADIDTFMWFWSEVRTVIDQKADLKDKNGQHASLEIDHISKPPECQDSQYNLNDYTTDIQTVLRCSLCFCLLGGIESQYFWNRMKSVWSVSLSVNDEEVESEWKRE